MHKGALILYTKLLQNRFSFLWGWQEADGRLFGLLLGYLYPFNLNDPPKFNDNVV